MARLSFLILLGLCVTVEAANLAAKGYTKKDVTKLKSCLEKGFESAIDSCSSNAEGDINQMSLKDIRICRKIDNKLEKSGFKCEESKPIPTAIPPTKPKPEPTPIPEPEPLACAREDQNFAGADFTNRVYVNLEDCAKDCRGHDSCKAVTFRKSDRRCYLKSKYGGVSGPSPHTNYVSMNMKCDNTPVSLECARKGQHFVGADLRNNIVANIEECVKQCRDTQDCKSLTFRESGKRCYLKYKFGGWYGPTAQAGFVSLNMECRNDAVDLKCEREGVNFPGADLRNIVLANIEECVKYCRDTEECKALTFRTSDQRCFLKKQFGGSSGPYPQAGLVSLNFECDNSPVSLECEREGQDFPGAEIRSIVLANIEECVKYCRDAELCKAVTFRKSDQRCYLKSKFGGVVGPYPRAGLNSLNMECRNDAVDLKCEREGVNFPGADLRNMVLANIEECVKYCRDTEECKALTFRASDQRCFLKKQFGGSAGPYPQAGHVSLNFECDNSPVSLECEREGLNFPGADIRNIVLANIGECVKYCRDAEFCKAVTFRKSDQRCFLKKQFGGSTAPYPQAGHVSLNLKCNNDPVDLSCQRKGVIFSGSDLRNVALANIGECVKYCRDSERCKSVTFRQSDNRCFLASKFGGLQGPSPRDGFDSLNMECNNEKVDLSCEKEDTNFPGNDIRNLVLGDLEECVRYCRDNQDCLSVTFRQSDNRCYMKRKEYGHEWDTRAFDGHVSINLNCANGY